METNHDHSDNAKIICKRLFFQGEYKNFLPSYLPMFGQMTHPMCLKSNKNNNFHLYHNAKIEQKRREQNFLYVEELDNPIE